MNDTPEKAENITFTKDQGTSCPPPKGMTPRPGQIVCGEIDMRIDADGVWFYHGSPITRKKLVRLFSTVVRRDEAGAYWLITPAEMARITVDDAPFLVVEMLETNDNGVSCLKFRTNVDTWVTADAAHPIRVVTDPDSAFPDVEATMSRVTEGTRVADGVAADVRSLVTRLFGDDQLANVFLVGMAYQAGAVPVAADDIEQAIELNGAAVARNVQAFRRGRQLVADPEGFHAALPGGPSVEPAATHPRVEEIARLVRSVSDPGLTETVLRRVGELVAYQNVAYATRYATFVEQVRDREESVLGSSELVTPLVARQLFKLMAYKDEYEVARLSLDPLLERDLKQQFGEDVRYSFALHPPVLRALGMRRKIALGTWFRPGFRLLYAMRHLRGTGFDPFGRAGVRRTERALVEEYTTVM
ncbi:MAG: DUF1285 domain-containing protein, partial [Rhodospirillales bacterium]